MYPTPPTHKAHGVTPQGRDGTISPHLMSLNYVLGAEISMVNSDCPLSPHSAHPSQRLFWFLRLVLGLVMGAVILSEYWGPGGSSWMPRKWRGKVGEGE